MEKLMTAPVELHAGQLEKIKTGIKGFDVILSGGLPKGRPTLLCGGPGCGKTMLAMEFLIHGILDYSEPGVFIAFEEDQEELIRNMKSLGYDLEQLIAEGKLFIDYIEVNPSEIEVTGEYDLEGLFLRLADAIQRVGAQRIALDTIETLFAGFANQTILRAELHRLFRWLKDRGMTAIITGERGDGALTRNGMEEYVSDCVILLDQRVREGIATRYMRIVKYRGSSHSSDEFPFLIGDEGVWVMPITSLCLEHSVSNEFVSSGIQRLDSMLDGKGYYRGSSILLSGTAGTGKTSLASQMVDAACRRGERCLYFGYEESPQQIIRNMRSIGINLEQWVDLDLLRFHAVRPSFYGAEMHLLVNEKLTKEFNPSLVIIDPITNLLSISNETEIRTMLVRMIDFFKSNHITALFTSLTQADGILESTRVGVSSLMDVWLLLRDVEYSGERTRVLYVLKARGIPHSNQLREFRLTDHGIEILDPYIGSQGVLTGSARLAQEAVETAATLKRHQEIQLLKSSLERKRASLDARIKAMQAEFKTEEEELLQTIEQGEQREELLVEEQKKMAISRSADDAGRAINPHGNQQEDA